MKLSSILGGTKLINTSGEINIEVNDIAYRSEKVTKGSVFVCLKGFSSDGHKFILDAIKRGAVAVVLQDKVEIPQGITSVIVNDSREALANMSLNFFGNPSKNLTVIGITGTKGKTTTACMIKSILETSGISTGMIGTLGVIYKDTRIILENTTPESYEVQKHLRNMLYNGIKCVIMEASSIGLKMKRLHGIQFSYGVFTNFSKDHIGSNEHKDMREYLECKKILFRQCNVGFLNCDDLKIKDIIEGSTCEIKKFGFSKEADIAAQNVKLISKNGYIGVEFDTYGKTINTHIITSIPGKFSVYNALAAISVCNYMRIKVKDIAQGLYNIHVMGRVEPVKISDDYILLIDYAHNAVSMENILTTLREYSPKRLITMFGSGGNRSKFRRYEMGEISGKLSDLSVITADNSRYEDVNEIIKDIKIGINKTQGKYIVIPDRKDAIRYCIENACKGDIIVLAGKGHEDYQELQGIKYPFDERKIIEEIINDIKNKEGKYNGKNKCT